MLRPGPGEIHSLDSIAVRHAAALQILTYERERTRVMINEHDVRRAAAQRLDADGAGSGKCVEHGRALTCLSQDVEQRLAQAIGGGPQARPGRRRQPAALQRARDDAQALTRRRSSRRAALADLDETEALAPRAAEVVEA